MNLEKTENELIAFVQGAVRIKSYSDEEEDFARYIKKTMEKLNYDEVKFDKLGNVIGRIGNGKTIIHFDGHMDTVRVNDEADWTLPPFSGEIVDGNLWGRGSVDMKSALCTAVYAAAYARDLGYTEDKTIYVTGSVCEEYCDGENLKNFYSEYGIKPDCCIICETCNNTITLGHKGKAQIRIKTHGISAHGSAPEKGKNAVYEMAEIISRVEMLNEELSRKEGAHGTIVLSDISCETASLNAVPSECEIYIDRRLALGESTEKVKREMDFLIDGKDAHWEIGTLYHTSWTGEKIEYQPMHNPWIIDKDAPLTLKMNEAYKSVFGNYPDNYDFWDFGTNAVTPVSMGIPTIGFGPGEYKLAHMINEHCSVQKIKDALKVYTNFIKIY
ncbi:MAG: YgeY family selenium metabolism-linked hydrolase [Candidatus Metalachnospira sp.]|nr:YgeY family selenium metabolism-linked hydrolase [Candidatus Metalachnospira sp.]